jgi:small glutamine-rich tetratricopeptide repeat-containing protein alpha
LKIQEYAKAATDCERALELDPNYSKAFGRLGYAQMHLNNLEKAKECYEKAMELDPGNESYSSSLGAVKLRLEAQRRKSEMTQGGPEAEKAQASSGSSSGSSSAPGGTPGLGGLPNMGNFASLLSNPAVMNMAQSVMSNPQLMQMAASFFGNATSTSAPSSGQSPSMESLFSVGRQMAEQMQNDNPDLVEQLRQQFGDDNGKVIVHRSCMKRILL